MEGLHALFTGVRGIGILRSSPFGHSRKFPYSAFSEVDQLQRLQLSHNTRRYRLPFWVPGLPRGGAMQEFFAHTLWCC
jgi:hypothetical protein